jgi:hypothetical protein
MALLNSYPVILTKQVVSSGSGHNLIPHLFVITI